MADSQEALHVRGDIEIKVRRISDGAVLQFVEVRNKIVSLGLSDLAGLLRPGSTPLTLGTLRVGTGTAVPAKTDVALGAPVLTNGSATLVASNVTLTGTDSGATKVRVTATLPDGIATGLHLSEAGLFLSNGHLLARQIHSEIVTASGLAFDYTWTLTFTA